MRYWIGNDPTPRAAYVHDISTTGVFIATPYPVTRGTGVRLEIRDGDTTIHFETVVARRVWVAPDLRLLGPTGMGVRFLSPEELVEQLRVRGRGGARKVNGEDGVFEIVLEDDKPLLAAYSKELEHGGFYIPTDSTPELNQEIVLEFRLPEPSGKSLRAKATVVQRVPPGQETGGLPAGIGVAFNEPEVVLAGLRPYLPSVED